MSRSLASTAGSLASHGQQAVRVSDSVCRPAAASWTAVCGYEDGFRAHGVRRRWFTPGTPAPAAQAERTSNGMESGDLELTENAVRRLQELQHQSPKDLVVLRLTVEGGGCSGFQYEFTLDNQVKPDDRCVGGRSGSGGRVLAAAVGWQKGGHWSWEVLKMDHADENTDARAALWSAGSLRRRASRSSATPCPWSSSKDLWSILSPTSCAPGLSWLATRMRSRAVAADRLLSPNKGPTHAWFWPRNPCR